jgi:diguanylate cyclase (GGDEF)-like protein
MENFTRAISGKAAQRSLLLLLIAIQLVLISGCRNEESVISAVEGVMDLSAPGSLNSSYVELKGEWGFFCDKFIESETPNTYSALEAEQYMNIPNYWSPYKRGTCVYSLRILLPPDHPDQLAVKMSNVLENYSLYADGALLFTAGKPGKRAEDSVAESLPALISLQAENDTLDLVIQVTNWKDVKGGLSRKIFFGDFQALKSYRERFLTLDALIIGAVMIMAIYHLAAYILTRISRHDPSYFFLGIAFLLIVLFIGSKNELLFKTICPDFSAGLRSIFIYSTLISSVPLFFCYIYFVFKELYSQILFKLVLIISCIVWLIIIFIDRSFYTHLLIPLEVFNIFVSVYVIHKLIRYFVKNKEVIVLAFLVSYLMLVGGVVFSMLDNMLVVPPWTPGVVFLGFTFFQTVLQAHTTASYIKSINQLNTAFIEMEKETEKLYDLSNIDPLTSIANRRFLNDYMQKLWERNTITKAQIGIIFVDIDYFKLYNDRYGHLAGDLCLEKVSTRFKELMNRKGDLIARYGGEEFVAVFQNCPQSELCRIAERLRDGIEELKIEHLDSQCSESVTVSAGAASEIPVKGSTWLSLFKKADDALYRAKQLGRNRIDPCPEPDEL